MINPNSRFRPHTLAMRVATRQTPPTQPIAPPAPADGGDAATRRLGLLRDLVARLPRCYLCSRPAVRLGWHAGQDTCDEHAVHGDAPWGPALRAAIAEIEAADGGAPVEPGAQQRAFLEANIGEVSALLVSRPEGDVLGRDGLESRLEEMREELARLDDARGEKVGAVRR